MLVDLQFNILLTKWSLAIYLLLLCGFDCYNSATFYCFPWEQSVLGDFFFLIMHSSQSHYGRNLHFDVCFFRL